MTSGNMTLGEIIRHHRQQQGLSQPELASKSQIEQSYLSKLENDNSYPSDDILKRVMAALNLDIADLCAQLDTRSADPKVMHIESIRTHMSRFRQHSQRRSVFLMAVFTLTIGIGCALFYVGHSKAFFPELQYSYESRGEVQPGEPADYFHGGWRRSYPSSVHSVDNELTREIRDAEITQANRIEYDTILSFQRLESNFIRHTDNGNRRFYRSVGVPVQVPRLQNGWFMFFGISMAISGVVALLLTLGLRGSRLGKG